MRHDVGSALESGERCFGEGSMGWEIKLVLLEIE